MGLFKDDANCLVLRKKRGLYNNQREYGAAWLRLGSGVVQLVARVGLPYERPEFESRLGTPEEALFQMKEMRITRVVLFELYIYTV